MTRKKRQLIPKSRRLLGAEKALRSTSVEFVDGVLNVAAIQLGVLSSASSIAATCFLRARPMIFFKRDA